MSRILIALIVVVIAITGCRKNSPTAPQEKATPTVTFVSPNDAAVLVDSLGIIEVTATDDKGISRVDIFIDGQKSKTIGMAPYRDTINTSLYPSGTRHALYARAYDTDENAESTPVITITTAWLAVPKNLQIKNITDTSAILQWENPTAAMTRIERSSDGVSFTTVDSANANTTTKVVAGVYQGGIIYSFRLVVKSGYRATSYSNIASAKSILIGPSGLTITSISDIFASLQWTDNSSFETGFLIEQSSDGTIWTLVDSVDAGVTMRDVPGTYIASTTYSFRVRAKSLNNMSTYSNSAIGILFIRDALMVPVIGGTFQMGSNDALDTGASPPHSVTVGSYYIDKYEITYEKWTTVAAWGATHGYTDLQAGTNGDNAKGVNNPVTTVSWYDVVKWCNARSEKDGLSPVYYTSSTMGLVYRTGYPDLDEGAVKWTANGYRLPTEAEWEFAAKGGTKTNGYTYSGSNTLDIVGWYSTNSGSTTHTVGQKTPNELGIYDMSGNVWEWCWDWYGSYTSGAATDPKGPQTMQDGRLLRGGASGGLDGDCRTANRIGPYYPSSHDSDFAFRCVQD